MQIPFETCFAFSYWTQGLNFGNLATYCFPIFIIIQKMLVLFLVCFSFVLWKIYKQPPKSSTKDNSAFFPWHLLLLWPPFSFHMAESLYFTNYKRKTHQKNCLPCRLLDLLEQQSSFALDKFDFLTTITDKSSWEGCTT